jgi:hypothetical protein
MNGELCRAHSKSGKPCGKYPIAGAAVCRFHGGASPQVKRKAEERLRALQPPAIRALEDAVTQADVRQLDRRGNVVTVGPDHRARVSAATVVLDRTGMGPSSSQDVTVTASVHLAALIATLDATPTHAETLPPMQAREG